MIHSLRGRLFIGLAIVVAVVGFVGGAIAYDWAFDEAIESQDTVLTQIAAVAARTRFENDHPISGGDLESQITIRELGDRPNSADPRAMWLLVDGLHDVVEGSRRSRVMMRTRADRSRFVVAQPTAIRDEVARDSAAQALLPFVTLIPCLVFVFAIVIKRSLRPMSDLAARLDERRADDLAAMEIEGTPAELHPFIGSINRLFVRVQTTMDQQRRFIADAAHELRTPITALSLQAENLQQTELSPDGQLRLARLRDGARRTAHLLEQLLALARYDAGPIMDAATTELDVCAKQVVAALLPQAAALAIDLGFDIIEPVVAKGDTIMVSAIIRNLIDNALHATPSGGKIDVGIFRDGDRATIRIVDSGPGIPDGDLDRIFEPFFRGARPSGDGTGLGLAIVKRIVDQLEGSVSLQNIAANGQGGLSAVVRISGRRNSDAAS